jgi:long-chain acyl-CoA synthetase
MNNLAELLQQWSHEPHRVLYRQFVDDQWRDYDVATLLKLVARWRAGYVAAGMLAGDRIALCMKNGVQWVITDLAAHSAGLVVVPLYVDDNAENIAWCLQDSGARLLVTDHLRFLPGLQEKLADLPQMVLVRGVAKEPTVHMDEWLPDQDSQFSIVNQPADTLATIVYTSGTTGRSKGVMLSHYNILTNIAGIVDACIVYGDDRLLSVLPMSHMFERTAGYYLPLNAGAMVVYCRGVNELAQDLVEQQPTAIMAVPRLFQRILTRIDERLARAPIQRWMFQLAAWAGWRRFNQQGRFYDPLILHTIYPKISRTLKERLGGHLRVAVMGGAALDKRVAEVFIGLGLTMLQGYGLTETSPVISVNRFENNNPASVGPPMIGVEIKLSPASELMVRGSLVMQGYWKNPTATQLIIDSEGWLNTGDIVEIKDNRIYIRGRSKNILVLSNGEKIAPEDIEKALLQDATFEQVMVIGEGRPYLALVTVSKEKDEQALLRHANQLIRHLPRYARIRRVIVAHEPWTAENDMLTPTLKLKRDAVYKLYERQIEKIYRSI